MLRRDRQVCTPLSVVKYILLLVRAVTVPVLAADGFQIMLGFQEEGFLIMFKIRMRSPGCIRVTEDSLEDSLDDLFRRGLFLLISSCRAVTWTVRAATLLRGTRDTVTVFAHAPFASRIGRE
jgi:hypothetical protein